MNKKKSGATIPVYQRPMNHQQAGGGMEATPVIPTPTTNTTNTNFSFFFFQRPYSSALGHQTPRAPDTLGHKTAHDSGHQTSTRAPDSRLDPA